MEARGFDTADCTFFLSGHIFFKDIARGFAISHMFTLHKMDYKFPHSFCKAHQEARYGLFPYVHNSSHALISQSDSEGLTEHCLRASTMCTYQ